MQSRSPQRTSDGVWSVPVREATRPLHRNRTAPPSVSRCGALCTSRTRSLIVFDDTVGLHWRTPIRTGVPQRRHRRARVHPGVDRGAPVTSTTSWPSRQRPRWANRSSSVRDGLDRPASCDWCGADLRGGPGGHPGLETTQAHRNRLSARREPAVRSRRLRAWRSMAESIGDQWFRRGASSGWCRQPGSACICRGRRRRRRCARSPRLRGFVLAMTFVLPLDLVDPDEREVRERWRRQRVRARRSSATTPLVRWRTCAARPDSQRCSTSARIELTRRYFAGRDDGLRPPTAEHLITATVRNFGSGLT